MMTKKLATSKEFKLRLIDLQYRNLPKEEMIQQIRHIYLEEHGEKLDAKVDVFNSYQSSNKLFDSSGYDGTAIHFSSEKSNVNEVYIVSQRSKDALDWEYNVKAR